MPWLQSATGERTFLGNSCQIGRGTTNAVVLPGEKVSRRHAMIHRQGESEFWLIDLGSANGTYVNGRRISQPLRLEDTDIISIGDYRLQFFHPTLGPRMEADTANKTIQEIRNLNLWLLLADVEKATQLAERFPAGEAPRVMGQWLASCKQLIDENEGTINKFLGDGFFAYWRDEDAAAEKVARTLIKLKEAQDKGELRFRTVLHYGKVFAGGVASMGEESLMGNQVNFVFRVEKLAGSLGVLRVLSEPASQRINAFLASQSIGSHAVHSFDGQFPFFTF